MNANLKEDLDFILKSDHKNKEASQFTATSNYYMHIWSCWYEKSNEDKEDYARVDIYYDTISNWLYYVYVYRQNDQVIKNEGGNLTWEDVLETAKLIGLTDAEVQEIQNFATKNPYPNK